MGTRLLSVVGLSLSALFLATSVAPGAGAATAASRSGLSPVLLGRSSAPVVDVPDDSCFSNLTGDTGAEVVSQNFESDLDSYDSVAADDFQLAQSCIIDSIQVTGQYFNGPGAAVSENVTFYQDDGGAVGSAFNTQTVTGADSAGSFTIPLTPIALTQGTTYWVSVQANMDLSTGGEWGWESTTTGLGNPAQWENPGDGFATGCTSWSNLQACIGTPGSDLMFALNGEAAALSQDFGGYTGDLGTGTSKPTPSVRMLFDPPTERCLSAPDGTLVVLSATETADSGDWLRFEITYTCAESQTTVALDVTTSLHGRLKVYPFRLQVGEKDPVSVTVVQSSDHTIVSPRDPHSGLPTGKRTVPFSGPTTFSIGVVALDPGGKPYHLGDFGVDTMKRVMIEGVPLETLDPVAVTLVDGDGNTLVDPGPIKKNGTFATMYEGASAGI